MVFDAENSNVNDLSFKRSNSVGTDSTLSEIPNTSESEMASSKSGKGVPICYVLGVCLMGVFAGVFAYMSGDNLKVANNYPEVDDPFMDINDTIGVTASGMRTTDDASSKRYIESKRTKARSLLIETSWKYFESNKRTFLAISSPNDDGKMSDISQGTNFYLIREVIRRFDKAFKRGDRLTSGSKLIESGKSFANTIPWMIVAQEHENFLQYYRDEIPGPIERFFINLIRRKNAFEKDPQYMNK